MDINSSYTNLSSLGSVHATDSLEKLGSSLAINSASDDPSGLALANALSDQKTSLAQSVENMNSGIAMSNIAQDGLSTQQDLLEKIKTSTIEAMNGTMNEDDKASIQKDIAGYINQFDQVIQNTQYNGQKLLETKGDTTDDLSIATDKSFVSMEKADTTSVSDKLKSALDNFMSDPAAMLDAVDQGQTQIAQYASNFGSSANQMEVSAKGAISTEKELAQAKSTVLDIDYNKEVSNFSKANLQAQMSMAVQSQSNAVQSRNINLLS